MKKNLLLLNFFGLFLFTLFFGAGNLNAAPSISQPASVTVCAGSSSISFSVKTDFVILQWQVLSGKAWVNIPEQTDPFAGMTATGTNTAKITLGFNKKAPLTTAFSGTQVRCVGFISGNPTSTPSLPAVATVVSAPSISSSSSGIFDLVVDQYVSFNVTAIGSGISYQWQFDPGTGIFSNISGANYSDYTIKYASLLDAGLYRCMVTNGICAAQYGNINDLRVADILSIENTRAKNLHANQVQQLLVFLLPMQQVTNGKYYLINQKYGKQ